MTEPLILIASSSLDEATHRPVCEHLDRRGVDYVLYETDRVIRGNQEFFIRLGERLEITCDGRSIHPTEVTAAWLWKVASFRNPDAETNVSKQLSMVNELALWNATVWGLYPDDVWINSPARSLAADQKLMQLQEAMALGFAIPTSVVSSQWPAVAQEWFADGQDRLAIVKMLRGVLADQNKLKAMYTEVLDAARFAAVRSGTHAFPGLYQDYVPKSREWRVTVVGDVCFPVAIYTDNAAKDDWRRHQLTSAVQYRLDPFPSDAAERCIAFLRRFELRYGAFDLVERPDGQMVFLECNPNGQHNWLEEAVGIPVADALASELVRIASGDG